MEPIEITTGGLLLRPWRPEDADAVCRACQDPDIQRWTTVPRPYLREHAVTFVTGFGGPEAWASGRSVPLGVFDAATGELLGSHGLVSIDGTTAEIGYWTAPTARGRGVATVAGRAVARLATERLGITRLVWRAGLGNHGSRLVARRIGFTMEGLLLGGHEHRDGTREDCWVGSLRPGEITDTTPAHLSAGSPAARRAAVFGAPQPTLALTGAEGMLRPYVEADIPRTVEACRDPATVEWTPVPADYRESDAVDYIGRAPRAWLRGDGAIWVIADADGAYCGAADIGVSADDPGVAEVGYQVAPWARGKGLATAATRTIVDWGFDELGLERILWSARIGNHASRRVAEKVGFRSEGVARARFTQRGTRRDMWVAAMLAADRRDGHVPAQTEEVPERA